MKKFKYFILFMMSLFLSSCGNRVYRSDLIIPTSQAVSHNITVKTFNTDKLNKLDINLKNAQIYIMNWIKKDVKVEIEITEQVESKGAGKQQIRPEDAYLMDFKDDSLVIKEPIKPKSNIIKKITINCPCDIKNISANIENGSFTSAGDLISVLKLKIAKGNFELARFKGTVDAEVLNGNIIIGSGRLNGESKFFCKAGSINVKTEIIKNDNYSFKTEVGNVELSLPAKTAGDFTYQGNVLSNAFTSSSHGPKIIVSSIQGIIEIKKY